MSAYTDLVKKYLASTPEEIEAFEHEFLAELAADGVSEEELLKLLDDLKASLDRAVGK